MQINSNRAIQLLNQVHKSIEKPKGLGPAQNPASADDTAQFSDAALKMNRDVASNAFNTLMDEMADKIAGLHGVVKTETAGQGRAEKAFKAGDLDDLTQEQAQELLEGYFSAENTATRIFDFAFSFYDGSSDREAFAQEMKGYIHKGFNQAEKMLGGLADISLETRDLIDQKVDDFIQGDEKESAPTQEVPAENEDAATG